MWGTHWTINFEKRGVPSVYIVDEPFVEAVKLRSKKEGMPALRRVIVPHECGDITDEQLTGIIPKIVDALTKPLTKKEKKAGLLKPEKSPRITVTGTLEEVEKYFYDSNLTDGLPIIPPTEKKVKEMLKGTSHSPDEIVTTTMWPEGYTVNVEKVAIVGVMAGCKPEYMPVLLAIVDAFGKGAFSSGARSNNSFSFPILVNGPIRNKIGMNSGVNALGSGTGNKANATIGRFLRLAMISLGGSCSGSSDVSSQGNPGKYSFAFAENEERSPWEPFHVSMGYKPEESVVSIFSGGWSHLGNYRTLAPIAKGIATFEWPNGISILIDPSVARSLAKEGYTKQGVEEYIWKNATQTMGEFRARHYYRIFIGPILKGRPMYGVKYLWPKHYLNLPDDAVVPIYPRNYVKVIVVGGETLRCSQAWKFAYPSLVRVDKWM